MKLRLTPLQAKVVRAGGLSLLKPGVELPSERVLAEASGLGRAPVRGMLATMQKDGIVARSSRGWILRKAMPEIMPAEEGSRRQIAKDFLLAELGSGRLRPGDQISELALAKKIGVSTVSMREALLEIMPLGLLTKKERQKWEVATFTNEHISEMREFREMVEVFCLRKLLTNGLTAERRNAFEALRAESEKLIKIRRPANLEILSADLAFHRLLLEATGSSLLKERAGFIYLIIEFQLVSPFYSVENGKMGLAQHLQIIAAILREDLPSAQQFLIEHLRTAEQLFCAIVSQIR
ncbi:MAG: GntR family transcriptional regulator [Proteobacteria bacterium]|jgi:DNA-binding GntR family transcriptional regulator|nr:GntR family transcriptional regulator [Pseudomonadota bacterium]